MASFQNLRLAFTSIDSNNHYIRLLLANGVDDVLDIAQAPNTDHEAFLAWWKTEKERAARDEKKILVVCSSYEQSCYRKWLQNIEETEFYDNDNASTRVRFTTTLKLSKAINDGESLKDDWGEVITQNWDELIDTMSIDSVPSVQADDDQNP
jgi:hypothetical protein